MAYQLILTSDTLDQGRTKINDFFVNNSNLLSAGTGTNSVLTIGGANTARGNYSFVTGKKNSINAGANYSTILGGSGHSISTSFGVIGGGFNNRVFGTYGNILGGKNNLCGAGSSILAGINNIAFNYSLIIGGASNTATNDFGSYNLVGGFTNVAGGSGYGAYGNYSAIAWGKRNTISRSYGFIGGGRYNKIYASYSSILGGTGNKVATTHTGSVVLGTGGQTRAANSFIFANGGTTTTPAVTNNRFRIDSTGAATMNGALTQNGTADYAEYFEWEDQNPTNQDRTGYFVSINKDKIKIDNSNIIGIVSATPCIIGDGAEEFWNKLHKRDIWGREIYENYSGFTCLVGNKTENSKIYYIGPNNQIFKEHPSSININGVLAENISITDLNFNNLVHVLKINVFNENYNPDHEYIPRSERKEWAPIGLLGKLYVRTSEKITSTKIDVGSDGRAINGTKYHVLKTTKEFDGDFGIVQILFR